MFWLVLDLSGRTFLWWDNFLERAVKIFASFGFTGTVYLSFGIVGWGSGLRSGWFRPSARH